VGWVSKFFHVSKVLTALTIYTFFPYLFLGIHLLAEKYKKGEIWHRINATVFPLLGILYIGALLTYPSLGMRPGLLFTFLIILNLPLLVLTIRHEKTQFPWYLAAGISFLHLLTWTSRTMTLGLLSWGLGFYFLFAILYSIHPLLLIKWKKKTSSSPLGSIFPASMLILITIPLLKGAATSIIIWPFILLISLIGIVTSYFISALWMGSLVLVLTLGTIGLWIGRLPSLSGLPEILIVMTLFSLIFFAAGLYFFRKSKKKSLPLSMSALSAPDFLKSPVMSLSILSALFPILLLLVAILQLPLLNPAPVFGIGLLLFLLLTGLVLYQKISILAPISLLAACALQYTWHFTHFNPEAPLLAFPWYTLFFGFFLLLPFIFKKNLKNRIEPWIASAFSGPFHFLLFYKLFSSSLGDSFIGLLPGILAVIYLIGLVTLIRTIPKSQANRTTLLALFGGVALFFISLIFPLQFEKQWITVGWALEGLALVWLFGRIPHEGLKKWGFGLLIISFIRLTFNPAVFHYHLRADVPLLNWYLYSYGTVIACLFLAAKRWAPGDEKYFNQPVRSILNALGGLLTFLLLNIEIADFYSSGRTLTFEFSRNLAQDMTYSLAWGLFGLIVLILGIKWGSQGARRASLGLLILTILKLFLHDLWRLGQLYRVGAFIGLALVLMFTSFLYQKYVSPKTEPKLSAKNKGDPHD